MKKIIYISIIICIFCQDISFALAPESAFSKHSGISTERFVAKMVETAIENNRVVNSGSIVISAISAILRKNENWLKTNGVTFIVYRSEVLITFGSNGVLRYFDNSASSPVTGYSVEILGSVSKQFISQPGTDNKTTPVSTVTEAQLSEGVDSLTVPISLASPNDDTERPVALRIEKEILSKLHRDDIEGIRKFVAENRPPVMDKRTDEYKLKYPVTIKWGQKDIKISVIYAKGVLFDSNGNLSGHYGSGYAPLEIRTTPDGRIEVRRDPPSPEGACTLKEAEKEFLITHDIFFDPYFQNNGIMAKYPIGIVRFPGLTYELPAGYATENRKVSIGAVLTGANTFQNLRYGRISSGLSKRFLEKDGAKTGSMLLAMHKRGIAHKWLHSGNFMIFEPVSIVHDLGLSRSVSRDKLSPRIFMAELFADLYYAVMKLNEQEGPQYGEVFINGYFGEFAGRQNVYGMMKEIFELGKKVPVYDIDQPLVNWLKDNVLNEAFGTGSKSAHKREPTFSSGQFVFDENTDLAAITDYLDAMRSKLSDMGLTGDDRKRKDVINSVLWLRTALRKISFGRSKKHSPCVNCLNSGGCPIVDKMMSGKPAALTKVHAGCSNKCRISDEDLAKALDAVSVWCDEMDRPDPESMEYIGRGADSEVYKDGLRVFKVYGECGEDRIRYYQKITERVRELLTPNSGKDTITIGGDKFTLTYSVNPIRRVFTHKGNVTAESGFVSGVRMSTFFPHNSSALEHAISGASDNQKKLYRDIFSDRTRVIMELKTILGRYAASISAELGLDGISLSSADNVMIDIDPVTKKISLTITDICPAIEYLKPKQPQISSPKLKPEDISAATDELRRICNEAVVKYKSLGNELYNFIINYDPIGKGPYWASPYDKAAELLLYAGAKKGDKILDVGHGAGDTISLLAHIFGLKATGVEILPEHHKFAVFLRDLMVSEGYLAEGQVVLENRDFMDAAVDFSEQDFIYYFCKGTNDKKGLLTRLLTVKTGAKILMFGAYEPKVEDELTREQGFTCEIWEAEEVLPKGYARIYTRSGQPAAAPEIRDLTEADRRFRADLAASPFADNERILLSESLFTDGSCGLDEIRLALAPILNKPNCPIEILNEKDIMERVTNARSSRSRVAAILSADDVANNSGWKDPGKSESIKATVLFTGDKLTGPNYLYLTGLIGYARAVMASDRDKIAAYYKLLTGKDLGADILGMLDTDLSENTISFAIKTLLQFRQIVRIDPEEFNKLRISMENFLISA